jgi:hypothetical protein
VDTVLVWVEFLAPDESTYYWSGLAIPDPSTYYGGFKDARVLSWGGLARALSDREGQYQGSTFSFELSDMDRTLRTWLGDAHVNRTLRHCEVVIRAVTDANRRLHVAPKVVARGFVRTFDPHSPYTVSVECEDFLVVVFGPARLEAQIPRRVISTQQFDNAPEAALGQAEPIIYGAFEGANDAVGLIPVGTEDLTTSVDGSPVMITYSRFLVASHTLKAITHLYIANEAQDVYPTLGIDCLVPGFTRGAAAPDGVHYYWDDFFPQRWIYRGGRTYTLVYLKGDLAANTISGQFPVTLGVQGVEDLGDGTGNLIVDVSLQFEHFVRCFGIQDYQSGYWPESPRWGEKSPTDSPLPMMETDSFILAADAARARLTGGVVGGGIIGSAFSGRISLRDAIARFCQSADVECFFNADMQFAVSFLSLTDAASRSLTEQDDIVEGTFAIDHRIDEYITAMPVNYNPDYFMQCWGTSNEIVEDAAVVAADQQFAPTTDLWFIRSSAIAEHILTYRLARTRSVPRMVSLTTGIHGVAMELGDVVAVTHREGTGPTGWMARRCRVEQIDTDLTQLAVSCLVRDLEWLSVPGILVIPGVTYTRIGTPTASGTPLYLRFGSRQDVGSSGTVGEWYRVADGLPWHINPAHVAMKTVTLRLWGKVEAGGGVLLRLRNLTDASTVIELSAAITATEWEAHPLLVAFTGSTQELALEWSPTVAGKDCWACGTLEAL